MADYKPVDTLEELQKEWRNPYIQWYAAGMPAFVSENKEAWKQLTLKFKSMEDRMHFGKAMDYKITEKTAVVWYPKRESEQNQMSRYVEE